MRRFLILSLALFIISGCAELQNIIKQAGIKKPTAQVTNSKINGLSFSSVDLLFDIQVDNPNSVGVNLAGMDYSLMINQNSLFSGDKNDPLKIEATKSSTIQIPVTLKFKDIYQTVKDLGSGDKSTYSFKGGLSFNLPVLGAVRIPISKSGEIPLIKLPKISVKNISLKNLSWNGAAMQLDIGVKGTGGMALFLEKMNYGLNIGGREWVSGQSTKKVAINPSGEQVVSVPFKLDFLSMGRAVYDIVTGDAALDYKLTGDMKLSADNPLLKAANISFDDLSKIKISK
jgi:LEA14-like dessication related protein